MQVPEGAIVIQQNYCTVHGTVHDSGFGLFGSSLSEPCNLASKYTVPVKDTEEQKQEWGAYHMAMAQRKTHERGTVGMDRGRHG